MFKDSTVRLVFIAAIMLGLGFLFLGFILIPVLPHLQLDAMLTEDEFKDDALRNSTLAMLKKASGNQWLYWAGGGAVLAVIGAVGLLASRAPASVDLRRGV